MLMKRTLLSVTLIGLLASAAVADDSSASTSVFEPTQVLTMVGQKNAANRFDHIDFSSFEAGSGLGSASSFTASSRTEKGFIYFDLSQDGLREALQAKDGRHALLSVVLLQVTGKPRPLRVEYIGTTNDKDSSQSRKQQFQVQPLGRVNTFLQRSAEPGLKAVDLTQLLTDIPSDNRWLILRIEQEGYRIEDGQNDIYQFNPNTSSVRLTLTSNPKDISSVTNHYDADGLGGILPDMHKNILPDMQKNVIQDMPSDLTPGLKDDILPDMDKDNIIQDMPQGSIIQDQNNQQ